jgi:hypothetical protein
MMGRSEVPDKTMKSDYDDPEVEAQWLKEQHATVKHYLDREEVRHRGVASAPEWFLTPYVSVWKVESDHGVVGWWAISGDLPTDYISGSGATDARSALSAFARRWREASACMARGEEHSTVRIGNVQNRRELGDLLSRRAEILQEWVNDDAMW